MGCQLLTSNQSIVSLDQNTWPNPDQRDKSFHMQTSIRPKFMALAMLMLLFGAQVCCAQSALPTLTVLVLRNSPPMSYRDESGALTGFNVELAGLVCEGIKARCDIQETLLTKVIDQIAAGEADFSTASLTITPERALRVLFTEPVRRERTLWVSKLPLSQSRHARVAAVEASLQHRWADRKRTEQDWSIVTVKMNGELGDALTSDRADAIVVAFDNSIPIMKGKGLIESGYNTSVIESEELSGALGIAVNPARKELRDKINAALLEIKKNGQLERINSKYFPYRVF
jgi:ABC-type amino acid transport substrate-binding protein